jgi:electron transport complex protein RnfC
LTALIPEPGLETAAVLWHDQHTTLAAGAALLARLWPDTELREVLPRTAEPLGIGRAIPFGGRFPMTQKALLKKAILGIFDPAAAGVVEPRLLWAMGSVARGGMPLTHLPFAFQRSNFLAPLGLKICDALEGINLIVWPGDVVVLGGLVTGRPASNLDQGLDWSTLAVHLVRSRRLPPPPQPCRRCRRCAQACPLKLPIDYFGALPLDRWPEVTAAAAAGLSGCPACGACALACPASRPLSALTMAAARISSSGDLGLDKDCQGRGPAGRPINEPQTASRNVS